MVKQLSVFLENSKGRLASMTRALGDARHRSSGAFHCGYDKLRHSPGHCRRYGQGHGRAQRGWLYGEHHRGAGRAGA